MHSEKNAYPCREPEPGEFRADIHQGGTASLIIPTAEEKRIAIKAARCMDFKVAGVDIIRLLKQPLLLEVHSSRATFIAWS